MLKKPCQSPIEMDTCALPSLTLAKKEQHEISQNFSSSLSGLGNEFIGATR
jgi:hypothetical protein